MPPKPVDKKGKKPGKGPTTKVIDPADYIRKFDTYSELTDNDVSFTIPLSGRLINIETLFPEWHIEDENWAEAVQDPEIHYPSFLGVYEQKSIRNIFGLEIPPVVDSKGKAPKKETKKPAKGAAPADEGEKLLDENGKKLPRIYIEQNQPYSPHIYNFNYPFLRNAPFPTVLNQSDFTSLSLEEKGEEDPLHTSPGSNQDPSSFIDPLLVSAFSLVSRFGPSLHSRPPPSPTPPPSDPASPFSFLWSSIHPQLPSTLKPVYSPSGKYCVRLFLAGKWRKVTVSDSMPFRKDGLPALASTFHPPSMPIPSSSSSPVDSEKNSSSSSPSSTPVPSSSSSYSPSDLAELWPLLLSKAIHLAYTACGYHKLSHCPSISPAIDPSLLAAPFPPDTDPRSALHFISFAVHCLTGWLPSSPWSLAPTLLSDPDRASGLVEEMLFGGAALVPEADIPRDLRAEILALDPSVHIPGLLPAEKARKREKEEATQPPSSPSTRSRPDTSASRGDSLTELLPSTNPSELSQTGEVMKTKKQFAMEYRKRNAIREAISTKIQLRTTQINLIDQHLSRAFSDFFVVSYFDPHSGHLQTCPVLAVSVPTKASSLYELSLLLDWKVSPAPSQNTIESPNHEEAHSPGTKEKSAQDWKELVAPPPLPAYPHLTSRWAPLSFLASINACFLSLNTLQRETHRGVLGWHWTPAKPPLKLLDSVPSKDKKAPPKGKEKDKGSSEMLAWDGSPLFEDPGELPSVFLSLDASSFFDQMEADEEFQSYLRDNQSQAEREAAEEREREELQLAIQDQEQALSSLSLRPGSPPQYDIVQTPSSHTFSRSSSLLPFAPSPVSRIRPLLSSPSSSSSSPVNLLMNTDERDHHSESFSLGQSPLPPRPQQNPVANRYSHLSLSVAIHADLVSLQSSASDPDPSLSASQSGSRMSSSSPSRAHTPTPKPSTATDQKDVFGLVDDVVLVLQEVRLDGGEPLVMRVQLSPSSSLPLTRTSFHIPLERLPRDRSQPFVFWIRLFTRSSVYISFTSGVKLTVGEAGSVWKGLGLPVSLRQGEAPLTRSNTEQILFRYPLLTSPSAPPGAPLASPVSSLTKGGKPQTPSKREAADQPEDSRDPLSLNLPPNSVLALLDVSNREVGRHITVLDHEELYSQYYCLPSASPQSSIQTNSHTTPRHQYNILRLQPGVVSSFIPRVFSSDHTLPPFNWKLTLLSLLPLEEPTPSQAAACGSVDKRVSGKYIPNNKLVVFRDVLSVDRQSIPLALRVSLSSLPGTEPLDMEQVCLVLRAFRKSDRTLIREFRARRLVQVYSLPIQDMLASESDQVEGVKKGAQTPAKKDGKAVTGKKDPGSGSGSGGSVEVIIEVALDETAMTIPPVWRSRVPLSFDLTHTADPSEEDQVVRRPPSPLPQFCWHMEVMAGTVLSSSHDTYDLERCAALKNSWEERAEGRADQALAAYQAFKLRENSPDLVRDQILIRAQALKEAALVQVNTKGKPPSSPSKGPSSGAFPSPSEDIVDLISTALSRDPEEILAREEILLRSLPYREFLEIKTNEEGIGEREGEAKSEATLIPSSEMEADRRKLRDRIQSSISHSEKLTSSLEAFQTQLQSLTAARVEGLLLSAARDWNQFAAISVRRDKWRQHADKLNSSLSFLVAQGKEAVQKEIEAEEAEAEAAALAANGGVPLGNKKGPAGKPGAKDAKKDLGKDKDPKKKK